jgi:hypothetical protein
MRGIGARGTGATMTQRIRDNVVRLKGRARNLGLAGNIEHATAMCGNGRYLYIDIDARMLGHTLRESMIGLESIARWMRGF